jgi:hypothetical protein
MGREIESRQGIGGIFLKKKISNSTTGRTVPKITIENVLIWHSLSEKN